jgi:hypothetical protein
MRAIPPPRSAFIEVQHEVPFGGRTINGSATGRHGRADRSERRVPSFVRSGARARGGGPPVAENAVVGARIYPESGSVAVDAKALGKFTQIPVTPSPLQSLSQLRAKRASPLSRLPHLASRISQRERPAGKGRPLGDFGKSRKYCVLRREATIRRARGR